MHRFHFSLFHQPSVKVLRISLEFVEINIEGLLSVEMKTIFIIFDQRLIGVKRNAERYKFWEPRLRVDPVWARSRRSRFSFCNAQPDLNFLVTFAKRRTFGPNIAFWAYFSIFAPKTRFWGPKRTFGSKIDFGPKRHPFRLKTHWFYKHPRHGDAETHFTSKFKICTKNHFLPPKMYYGPEIDL